MKNASTAFYKDEARITNATLRHITNKHKATRRSIVISIVHSKHIALVSDELMHDLRLSGV